MGGKGLWEVSTGSAKISISASTPLTEALQILKPAGIKTSLYSLALEHQNQYGRPMRVGIDVRSVLLCCSQISERFSPFCSPFVDECVYGAQAAGIHEETQVLALQNVFSHMTKLRKTCADYVFVFKGPERPRIKREKKVKTSGIWWSTLVKCAALKAGYSTIQVRVDYYD